MQSLKSLLPASKPTAERQCARHGAYAATLITGDRYTPCMACIREKDEAEKLERQAKFNAEFRQRRTDNAIGRSGIPKRFADKTINGWSAETDGQREIKAFAVEYVKEFSGNHSGRCAMFLGNAGTGKSHLACAIGSAIISQYGKTAHFTTVADLDRKVRESKSFSAEQNESQVLAAFASFDLLILDEVGLQSGTDAESRAVFDVLNARYQDFKPTLFISNLGIADVKKALGPRVYDRTREDGGKAFLFDWGSARGE